MPYSSKLPNDPKNPKKKRALSERAKKGETGTVKDSRGNEIVVDGGDVTEDNFASCPQCGSLGGYIVSRDARNAEALHQQRVHGNSPGKATLSQAAQQKRNKNAGE